MVSVKLMVPIVLVKVRRTVQFVNVEEVSTVTRRPGAVVITALKLEAAGPIEVAIKSGGESSSRIVNVPQPAATPFVRLRMVTSTVSLGSTIASCRI